MSTDTEREAGIKAIIELQKIVGINESREQAENGWDAMNKSSRAQTMLAHQAMCGEVRPT